MRRVTVYLTRRTYEQLISLAGAPVPQLINMTARSLLSFAIRAMFQPGLTIEGRSAIRKLGPEDTSPTEGPSHD
jgi:hypothetical protein